MKAIEFVYWLQGYFEVCEADTISADQFNKIKNHLKMVRIVEGNKPLPFCDWLSGLIDSVENNQPTKHQTLTLRNKLDNLFLHVVGDKLAQQNNTTSNYGSHESLHVPHDTNIRC